MFLKKDPPLLQDWYVSLPVPTVGFCRNYYTYMLTTAFKFQARIYQGQNSSEIWGGLPVVLLFGDDYQLMPVDKNDVING